MINYQEIFKIFEFNNINKSSSAQVVLEALGHLNYNEADIREAMRFLKSQGWASDYDPAEAAQPAAVQAPVLETKPVAPVQQPAVSVTSQPAEAAPVETVAASQPIAQPAVFDRQPEMQEKPVNVEPVAAVQPQTAFSRPAAPINQQPAAGAPVQGWPETRVQQPAYPTNQPVQTRPAAPLASEPAEVAPVETVAPAQPVSQAASSDAWTAAAQQTAQSAIAADVDFEVKKTGGSKKILFIALFSIIILAAAGLAAAYLLKIGPFSLTRYTEDNFFSGILAKSDQINTASYKISGLLEIVDRDEDAKPFSIKEPSNAAQLKKQYENDSVRIDDASAIIRELNDLADYSTYYASTETKPYPENLSKLTEKSTAYSYFDNSIKDPVTGQVYDYKVTEGGKNFALTINFETNYALEAVNKYSSYYGDGKEDTSEKTIISGKRVTFTKDSTPYMYMSQEPPKPFLVALGDSLRLVSPDIRISSSVSASSETKKDVMPDWTFNLNAEGDFGDLSYKINADALKKGSVYYLKVNNFPSIFLGSDLGLVKGKWISITPQESSDEEDDYSFSLLSLIKENISKAEEGFKENREKSIKYTRKAVTIADEENLIAFKQKPTTEKVDGQQLVRYDLSIRKEAILPFYTRLQEEINNDPDLEDFRDTIDQGLIDYLKSDEFNEVFDYFNDNNFLVLWTDEKGFPAKLQNTLRIVPPDTAKQLKEKQIEIVFEWSISDINEELKIEAPEDAVSIDDLIEDYKKNLEDSDYYGDY